MPIFLDQSLRKALLSKIKDVFGQDEFLAGQVRILEQETFVPEVENQVVLTDLQVTNDSLDSGNKVTELSGKVTFAPLGRPSVSFLCWAEENPQQTQLVAQGFYQLTVSAHSDPFLWNVAVDVIERVTERRKPWLGLKIYLDRFFNSATDIDLTQLVVTQDSAPIAYGFDYMLVNTCLILRRYAPDTGILFAGEDITDQCDYSDLVTQEIALRGINRPIFLPPGAILSSVSITDLLHQRQIPVGVWQLSQQGTLSWPSATYQGGRVLLQYYVRKPLLNWALPDEFSIALQHAPLIYKDGTSSLIVSSNIRGILPASMYAVTNTTLHVYEPFPQEAISVDYRSYISTLGPTAVTPASFNDTLIPGVCVTFTDNFTEGDQAVIIKHDHNKAIGQENGGLNRVELSLKIRAADDKFLERMTARLYYMFTDQTILFELADQGISLENALSYTRTFEERDGNQEKWLVNTFRLVVHHTWRYLLPYVTDLNSTEITTGFIVETGVTGSPTFKDLLITPTDNWIQDY